MFSVIFDMDGTLLDTQKICVPAWDWAGEIQGVKGMGEHICNVCGMNELGWTDYLIKNFPSLDLERFKNDARKYILDNGTVTLKDGAKELVEFLKAKGIKIGLASGSSAQSVKHHLNAVDMSDTFDAIAAGGDVKNGKPAPDIFLLTAQRLGVNPEDCFVFEDSANGIKAGFAAGMKCIGVPDMVPFDDDIKQLMFCELSSLSQAIPIFEKELK